MVPADSAGRLANHLESSACARRRRRRRKRRTPEQCLVRMRAASGGGAPLASRRELRTNVNQLVPSSSLSTSLPSSSSSSPSPPPPRSCSYPASQPRMEANDSPKTAARSSLSSPFISLATAPLFARPADRTLIISLADSLTRLLFSLARSLCVCRILFARPPLEADACFVQ